MSKVTKLVNKEMERRRITAESGKNLLGVFIGPGKMKIYTHKLTGTRLTIKKLFGSVASCRIVDGTIKMPYSITTDTIICSLDNLEDAS